MTEQQQKEQWGKLVHDLAEHAALQILAEKQDREVRARAEAQMAAEGVPGPYRVDGKVLPKHSAEAWIGGGNRHKRRAEKAGKR